MEKGKPAGKAPAIVELEPGKYHWCACGKSNKQPFCDGSHKGSAFVPMSFDLPEKKRVALCLCKQTQTPPFCDGSHKHI